MSKKERIVVRVAVNAGGEVLMIRRAEDRKWSGRWELPGGKVEWQEELQDAVIRETDEETSIKIGDLSLKTTLNSYYDQVHQVDLVFESTLQSKPKVTLSDEHQKFQWVDKNSWHKLELEPVYINFFKDYFGAVQEPAQQRTLELDDEQVIMYSDGGSRGNPGPSATGWVLFEADGETELARGGEYLGITTNNQAEYLAVKQGVQHAVEMGIQNLACRIDSMLVVKQMNGEYKIKNKDLWPVHQAIKQMMDSFQSVTFTHVYREHNTVADEIVNEVLDKHRDTKK